MICVVMVDEFKRVSGLVDRTVEARYLPTRLRVVGPFPDQRTAARWAQDLANNPHEVPTWTVADLPNPATARFVERPVTTAVA